MLTRSRAFSLVELLVVISIMAVLIGILIPMLAKAKQTARKAACMSNLKQIGIAIQSYKDKHDQNFPTARYMPAPFITSFPQDPGLPDALKGDISPKSKVYRCPGDVNYVYDHTGMSYSYNASLAGREVDESWLSRRLKFNETDVPVAFDADGSTFLLQGNNEIVAPVFHIRRNLLFADGHAGNYR